MHYGEWDTCLTDLLPVLVMGLKKMLNTQTNAQTLPAV